jgi:hypothetical protein
MHDLTGRDLRLDAGLHGALDAPEALCAPALTVARQARMGRAAPHAGRRPETSPSYS